MHHGLKIQGNELQSPYLKSTRGKNVAHFFAVFPALNFNRGFAFGGVLGLYVGFMIFARDNKSDGIP